MLRFRLDPICRYCLFTTKKSLVRDHEYPSRQATLDWTLNVVWQQIEVFWMSWMAYLGAFGGLYYFFCTLRIQLMYRILLTVLYVTLNFATHQVDWFQELVIGFNKGWLLGCNVNLACQRRCSHIDSAHVSSFKKIPIHHNSASDSLASPILVLPVLPSITRQCTKETLSTQIVYGPFWAHHA